jgi:hypothetical protein
MGAAAIIGAILPTVKEILEKYIGDKQKAEQAEKELLQTILEKKADIIIAEAKSESWLTRTWRPITMLVFTGLVVADWLGYSAPNLDPQLKQELYGIIKLGIGGYIGARTVEKVAEKVVNAKKDALINLFK